MKTRVLAGVVAVLASCAGCGGGSELSLQPTATSMQATVSAGLRTADEDRAVVDSMCQAAAGRSDDQLDELVRGLGVASEAELGERLGELTSVAVELCSEHAASVAVVADDVYGRLGPQLTSGAESITTAPIGGAP